MTEPARIQRKRTKGWRMPPNTVYVGRPSRWGNPWPVRRVWVRLMTSWDWSGNTSDALWHSFFLSKGGKGWPRDVAAEASVVMFRELAARFENLYPAEFEQWIAPLRGKGLACWCPLDQPCHADVLLDLANRPEAP